MKALIIVDVQNDFCKGGSLEVTKSNDIFLFINQLIKYEDFAQIYVTEDRHPKDHSSFATNQKKEAFKEILNEKGEKQMLWPVHCVQFSNGAELSPFLDFEGKKIIEIQKGFLQAEECYSGFGTENSPTILPELLRASKINEIVVVGLALDYCVGSTALDGIKEGYKVTVIKEATKPVAEESAKKMIEMFEKNGVNYTDFKTYSQEGTKSSSSGEESPKLS